MKHPAWAAWNDAKLTQDFPPSSTAAGGAYGISGDRLPNASRLSGNLSFDQEFPLGHQVTGSAGASVSYIGDSLGIFQSTAQPQVFPRYTRTDPRAGIRYDSWNLPVFVSQL